MTAGAVVEKLRGAADQLNLTLTPLQAGLLTDYLTLLERWNRTYNLTAVRDPGLMLQQHVIDCMALVGPLRREAGTDHIRLLDVGSGGGLPGVVIAVLLPGYDVRCVDSVGKKAAFVRQVSGELRLGNLAAVHARVESMKDQTFDVVTSRAFADLATFVELTSHLSKPSGKWVAMKGKMPADEIAALPETVDMFHVEQLAVPGMSADRCLVWLRHRSR